MSRKSVPFSVPEGSGRARPPKVIEARTDDTVSDRHSGEHAARPEGLSVDLGADWTLTQIVALSLLTPLALYGFWLLRVMSGRVRF